VRVEVRSTPAAAATAAADVIADLLQSAIGTRGRASLALSGGTTPAEMVRQLARHDVDWSAVDIFQVDERAVGMRDAARNWPLTQPLTALVPESNLYPMPVEAEDGDVQYARVLADSLGMPPVLDVVHLGLGTDGHTASLVPGDPVVEVADRDVAWVGEYQGHRRMTLTSPVLRAARHQVWLVAGASKAPVLHELLTGTLSAPAAGVLRDDTASVFADDAAAPDRSA